MLEVCSSETIDEVAWKVQGKVHVVRSRLSFSKEYGGVLENRHTLAHYGIARFETLLLGFTETRTFGSMQLFVKTLTGTVCQTRASRIRGLQ